MSRQDVDGWQRVEAPAEELAWEWDCGPFPVRDTTGTVLVAPALPARSTALRVKRHGDVSSLLKPLTTAVRQQGGGGPLSVSIAFHAVDNSLDRYPARTAVEGLFEDGGQTYRITEEAIPAGQPLTVFAVAARAGERPVLASADRGLGGAAAAGAAGRRLNASNLPGGPGVCTG